MSDHQQPSQPPVSPHSSAAGPAGGRFGEVLSRFVPLTRHDVYEVLEEQAGSGRKFGQIALAFGLCEPAHVWQAWAAQQVGRAPRVDLDRLGVDAQATADLPAWVAAALGVVPVRSTADHLVVAASEASLPRATDLLAAHARKPVTFVIADARQVERAVARYYARQVAATNFPAATACAGDRCGTKCRGGGCAAKRRGVAAASL